MLGSDVPRRWWRALRPPRVLEVQDSASVRVDGDDHTVDLRHAPRVCVVAHWDAEGRVSHSVCVLLRALQSAGFSALLVSSAPGGAPLTWVGGRPGGLTVLRRPNIGYDFGSWATALDRIPALRRCENLLLMNDSLAGPFASPAHLLSLFLTTDAAVWGLTDSLELAPHIQSYCVGFKRGVLEQPELRRFWDGIRVEADKERVVRRYEIGLSGVIRRMGIEAEAAIAAADVVEGTDNPTLHGWRRLLERGFPFVKRRVIRETARWSPDEPVDDVLRRRFDVELSAWL
ncbi:MAG TPA: rhamnan synthesis F family protein [Longimicrobiales bacterium]|nr:rhamnan synthesis F family protein [Longimicrobiales bacterium]